MAQAQLQTRIWLFSHSTPEADAQQDIVAWDNPREGKEKDAIC